MQKLSMIILLASSLANVAIAGDFKQPDGFKIDWSPCAKEIEQFKCGEAMAKSEADLYQCLLKQDTEISKECDNKSHSQYEKSMDKK